MRKKAGNLLEEKRRAGDQGDHFYDAAIIGFGFAGLACALMLGRHLVPTIAFDWGRTRNAETRRIHGYLGFENSSPGALVERGRREVLRHRSVRMVKGKVTSLSREPGGKYFCIKAGRQTFRAKFIAIATGVRDVKPEIEGFGRFDGDGAWHCPYCDGQEATGKKLAIIVSGKKPMAYIKEFLGWTNDIIVFPYRSKMMSLTDRKEASALGIRVVDDVIQRVSGGRGRLQKKLWGKRASYSADVIFYRLGFEAQTGLARQIGCELDKGYVKVDRGQQTSVRRVYAAGDIDTDRHYVVLAAAAGARAAMSIYEGLLSEAVKTKRDKSNK